MLKVFISEHDADYHGAVCGRIEKEFQSLADDKNGVGITQNALTPALLI